MQYFETVGRKKHANSGISLTLRKIQGQKVQNTETVELKAVPITEIQIKKLIVCNYYLVCNYLLFYA